MRHIHAIIDGVAILIAVMKEAKRHPEAETLADLDNNE